MSWDRIKIKCQCWEFDHNASYDRRSIFNRNELTKWKVGSEIDLMDYAISISPIRYNSYRSETNGNYNSLIQDVGDVRVQLSGIKDNSFLVNYFGIFETTGSIAYRQYLVDIFYDGSLVFTGYLNQDNIKEGFSHSTDSEIIEIQILGLEKEFKRYWEKRRIPEHSLVFNYGRPVPWSNYSNEEPAYAKAQSPVNVIRRMTDLTEVYNSPNLYLWFINNIPQFFYRPWSGLWWLKSGYRRFRQQAGGTGYDNDRPNLRHTSVYEFINYLMTSMGWVWRLHKNGDEYAFLFSNRSEYSSEIHEIDYQKLINLSVGYQIQKTDIDYIVMEAGYHLMPASSQGIPAKIISNKFTPNNNSQFFAVVENNSAGNGYRIKTPLYNNRYALENAVKQNRFDYGEFWYNREEYYPPDGNNGVQSALTVINSDKILFINGGSHDDHGTRVDFTDGVNIDINENINNEHRILFRGNAGDCCFKANPNNLNLIGQDYNQYTQTNLFKNNFISLIGGNNQTIEAEISGLIFNPSSAIRFLNAPNNFYGSLFAINELEADMINETTKIIAVRQT